MRTLSSAAAALALAATVSGGCRTWAPDGSEESEPAARQSLSAQEFDAVQGRLEELVPQMQSEAGPFVDLSTERLREDTCLRPEDAEPQTQTRWVGQLSGTPADEESADAALEAVRTLLEPDGWQLRPDEALSDDEVGTARELYLEKDGLSVTARFERAELVPDAVVILAATACTDHGDDRQMLRSPLDPEYGTSSSYYSD